MTNAMLTISQQHCVGYIICSAKASRNNMMILQSVITLFYSIFGFSTFNQIIVDRSIFVIKKGIHMIIYQSGCCENRGIMAHSSLTQTTVLKGRFNDDYGTKKEFFDNIKLQQEFAPR